MVQLVTTRVEERLRRLQAAGRADVRLYEGEERRTVGVAFLFTVYHRYRNELDRRTVKKYLQNLDEA